MPVILVVDDVRTEQEIIKKALHPLGCSFLVADTGTMALEIAAKERPALIVLDVVMPEMDGFKICRKLQKDDSTKNIPIILCTTKSGDAESSGERR